ncbi:aa3-type cytochrome c oxidase subunit IV [Sphingomonas nostoxanthinifaciens]|nr:aa3-type cytochrome c oxidase subunit IV [Sphingomonas nostoxanthinifaciens]UAK24954.1 aa3-type cytochrome c oxidase subunit IV [Sphingomonas nostoxanthinifaciens]
MAETGAKIDLPAHEQTYARFIGLFKYGAIACFAIAAIVVLIISR